MMVLSIAIQHSRGIDVLLNLIVPMLHQAFLLKSENPNVPSLILACPKSSIEVRIGYITGSPMVSCQRY